jgi:chromosomal replication initiation ATPase DnaA
MENIQVAARIRPLLDKEINSGEDEVFDINNQTISLFQEFTKKNVSQSKNTFTFDDVFSPDESNYNVYERKVKRVALSCLEGYNGTVFMYGQTGSGKTYTMLGY